MTMDYVSLAFLFAGLLGIVVILAWGNWSLRCNDRTHKTMTSMLKLFQHHLEPEECLEILRDFERVTYQQHFNAVRMGKSWFDLYSPRIKKFLMTYSRSGDGVFE